MQLTSAYHLESEEVIKVEQSNFYEIPDNLRKDEIDYSKYETDDVNSFSTYTESQNTPLERRVLNETSNNLNNPLIKNDDNLDKQLKDEAHNKFPINKNMSQKEKNHIYMILYIYDFIYI